MTTPTPSELPAWRSKTPVYTRYISDRRYRLLRPAYQRWYEPVCQELCCVASRASQENSRG